MPPRIELPEQLYRDYFREYVYALSAKWLGGPQDWSRPAAVLARIDSVSPENHRAAYLKLLLPLVNEAFREAADKDTLRLMAKTLYSMRMNDIYNDYMVNRFCDIFLESLGFKDLFAAPLPEAYKDLQKLVWTFIQTFRRSLAGPDGRSDPDAI